MGDFADLRSVVRRCAEQGAGFIGLNPLHALFPSNPGHFSPYSPSSRHFLNVLYVAVPEVPEYAGCAAARARVEAPEFQQELARLRATDYVDYQGVARAKLPVLRRSTSTSGRPRSIATPTARGRSAPTSSSAASRCAGTRCTTRSTRTCVRRIRTATGAGRPGPRNCAIRRAAAARVRGAATATKSSSSPGCSGSPTSSSPPRSDLARELGMPIGLYGDYAVGVNPDGCGDLVRPARLPHGRRRRRATRPARAQGPGLGHSPAGSARARGRAATGRSATSSPPTCATSARCASTT